MRRTTPITAALLVTASLALAACGDDAVPPAASDGTLPTVPPTTAPEASGYEHPTAADDVVISIEQEGGFAPAEMIFARIPNLLVSGDGRAFTPGPQITIYPGPLLPNVQVADVGEDGVQALLALADEHGLLQERTYESPANIADATDTVVTIRVGDETFVHRAYALGIEGGLDQDGAAIDDGARQELAAFVAEATSSGVTDTESFEPAGYLVRATPVDDLGAFDIEPTVVAWPDGVDVDLAAADDCVELAADAVGPMFADANELTFFEQAGTTYRLAVKPALPGSSC